MKKLNPNTYLFCDPAFQLEVKETELPTGFEKGNTIGINASPLAAKYGNSQLFIENYSQLVKYIVEQTDYQVALIPHVVQDGNDDRATLNEIYKSVNNPNRVVLVDDMDCMRLKYFISQCNMFIGARTHATIAAYSTCVPTLVTGYSVKAKGIACELFGTDENYVVPVQSFTDQYGLRNAFIWLNDHSVQIRRSLEENILDYKKSILKSKELIEQL